MKANAHLESPSTAVRSRIRRRGTAIARLGSALLLAVKLHRQVQQGAHRWPTMAASSLQTIAPVSVGIGPTMTDSPLTPVPPPVLVCKQGRNMWSKAMRNRLGNAFIYCADPM